MASITTYATLVQALKDVAEDDGTEFDAYIPTAIDLAEERLIRELELPDCEEKATGALTINQTYIEKPTGYRNMQYFKLSVSGSDVLLKKRTEDYLIDYWPNSTVADVPKYYADLSSTQFKLAPTPQLGYTYEMKYLKQPTKLSTTTTTNYFTDNCQDILFAACLVEMAKFMKAWSQVAVHEQTYAMARDTWNINIQRLRRDGGSIPNNPADGPNSLTHTMGTRS